MSIIDLRWLCQLRETPRFWDTSARREADGLAPPLHEPPGRARARHKNAWLNSEGRRTLYADKDVEDAGRRGDAKRARQQMIANTPMKRMGEAQEIAKAVLFLTSSDASFITGVDLFVDGGVVEL